MRKNTSCILGFFILGVLGGCSTLSQQSTPEQAQFIDQTALLNQGIDFYYAGQYDKAVDSLVTPAMQGNAEAQYYLGLLFDQSATEDSDFEQARMWYLQAAEQNHAAALNNLGVIYDKGLGVDKNRGLAADYFKKAALRGYARAQTNYGVMLVNGRGLEHDLDSAVYWFSLAAANGETDAMINLGYIAESGMSGNISIEDAIHWYTQAQQNDDINAHFRLATLYSAGNGVERDEFKATSLYYEAAALGHVESQLELWTRYRDGIGVQKDITEALGWLQRAADQGNVYAQLDLGKSYLYGRYSKHADDLALYWIYTAADAGSLEAQAYLAYMFEFGIGIDRNRRQAFALYRHVAGFDSAFAQLGVARLLADEELALAESAYQSIWLDRAKLSLVRQYEDGDWEAAFLLGELHADEDLAYYDKSKAAEYFNVALADANSTLVKNRLDALSGPAPTELISDADGVHSDAKRFRFLRNNNVSIGEWPLDGGRGNSAV